jgi:hypothetical protein
MAAPAIGPFEAAAQTIESRLTAIEASLHNLVAGQAAMQALLQGLVAQVAALGGVDENQRRASARRLNGVVSGEPFALVPVAGGAAPAAWPPGFCRAALRNLPSAAVNTLLQEYNVPAVGALDARRSLLAQHIGAAF